jgi:hypothetical protein
MMVFQGAGVFHLAARTAKAGTNTGHLSSINLGGASFYAIL